jgi:serralysin
MPRRRITASEAPLAPSVPATTTSKGSRKAIVIAVDANTARGGEQSFRFIGTQDFRGREGELRYQTFDQPGASNDITVISGDINGDHVADFEIEIVGILQFTSGDFLL